MNETDFIIRSCYRKKQYVTREEAKGVLARLRKSGVKVSDDQHPYECHYCGYYHLGKRTKKVGHVSSIKAS